MKITDNSYQFNLSKMMKDIQNHWNSNVPDQAYNTVTRYSDNLAGNCGPDSKSVNPFTEPFNIDQHVYILVEDNKGDIHLTLCPQDYWPTHTAWNKAERFDKILEIERQIKELQEDLMLLKS